MGERSFAEDVKQLGYGAGDLLHGEGILAITKALLQSGVSYVGGYPGAPVSYLIDVLSDANEPLLKPLGIYFEQSGSEAAAAALLGASINYPMRGAVTWKSVVGTNVASDALSHVASAGVIGGSVIVIGEDYGEGASILQERTHSTALKSSIPLLDPRNSLDAFARFIEEGFGLSEACNEPVFFSIRIRACHMRGTLRCRDNVRPAISMRAPLTSPSFSIDRINLPPFTYQMEAQKFETRLPAARRYIVEHKLNEHIRGDDRNPDKSRSLEPSVPGFLSPDGWRLACEPIDLPVEATQPGLRDFVLVRDTALLRGAGAMLVTAWVAFSVAHLIHGRGHGLVAAGTTPSTFSAVVAIVVGAIVLGFFATLSGACPLRQHVLAGQGRVGAWSFLAGFYLMAVAYTSWIEPSIGSWVL